MIPKAFLLLSLLAACVDLPEVPAGTCGNRVIEAGEDCDGFPDPSHDGAGLSCVECTYACDPSAQVIACPAGWGCGSDRRCRHGTGSLESALSTLTGLPGEALVAGDRDGDIAWDLVVGGDGRIGTLTAAERQLDYTLSPTFGSSLLAGADLDGDGLMEVLWPSARGGLRGSLGVRGGTQRPMLALGTFDIDQTVAGEQPASSFTQLVTVRLDDGTVVPYALIPQTTGLAWLDLSRAVRGAPNDTSLQGSPAALRVAVGNIDNGVLKRGDEIAIGYVGATTLSVRRADVGARLTITLPAPLVGAPVFGDVDSDGFVDLVAPIAGPAIAVAAGDGSTLATTAAVDPRFASQPPPSCDTGSSPSAGGMPRAIADLDGDNLSDFVSRDGIVVSLSNGSYCRALVTSLPATASAVVLDVNGDRKPDVALASGQETTVTLAINQSSPGGASFAPHSFTVSNVPIELRAGTFDWDRFDDLLVIETMDGVTHLELAKGTNLAGSQLIVTAPDAPGLLALASGAYDGDDVDDLVLLGTEPGRDAPYLAEVSLVGDGTDFFSVIGAKEGRRVTRILIGSVTGRPGTNDVVVVFDDPSRGGTTVWVYPDQGSYLTERGAFEAVLTTVDAASPVALADLDGDEVDELVLADDQGLLIYDLTTPAGTPARIAAPVAKALSAVRRPGADCVVVTSELSGAALECDLRGAPTSVVLTTEPVFGAVALNLDDDPDPEVGLVLGTTLATYDLGSEIPRDTFTLALPGESETAVCTGDLDGDGVSDLAVGSERSVELWWGVPHDRGHVK